MFRPSESLPQLDSAIAPKDRKNHDVDLARWVASAVRQHGGARKLRGYEREALEQEVALNVLRADRRRGTPRDVLAWIDRCERMPATSARMERATVSRIGALLPHQRARVLWRAVGSALESARWQEHSGRHRTAQQRQRDTGPMVEPSSGDEGTLLARSLDADSAQHGASAVLEPLIDGPWSSVDVARDLAYGRGWTTAQARNVALALERARCVALAENGQVRTDPTLLLLTVAAQRETSLNAVQAAAKRGVALLGDVDGDELVRAIRHGARMAQRGEQVALAAAAGEAVRTHALAGGSWDERSIHSARAMPDREPRVNVPVYGPTLHRTGLLPLPVSTQASADALTRVTALAPLPAVATVQGKRGSAPVAPRMAKRTPSPCRCEQGQPCPVHRPPLVARVTAGQRDRSLPVLPLWPSVSERVAAR